MFGANWQDVDAFGRYTAVEDGARHWLRCLRDSDPDVRAGSHRGIEDVICTVGLAARFRSGRLLACHTRVRCAICWNSICRRSPSRLRPSDPQRQADQSPRSLRPRVRALPRADVSRTASRRRREVPRLRRREDSARRSPPARLARAGAEGQRGARGEAAAATPARAGAGGSAAARAIPRRTRRRRRGEGHARAIRPPAPPCSNRSARRAHANSTPPNSRPSSPTPRRNSSPATDAAQLELGMKLAGAFKLAARRTATLVEALAQSRSDPGEAATASSSRNRSPRSALSPNSAATSADLFAKLAEHRPTQPSATKRSPRSPPPRRADAAGACCSRFTRSSRQPSAAPRSTDSPPPSPARTPSSPR